MKHYLIRCPKCGRENYLPAVATGICVWCGYDGNGGEENGRNEGVPERTLNANNLHDVPKEVGIQVCKGI